MLFDIIFIILFIWAAFKGFTKGFILQIASLAALILGIYGAIKFSSFLSEYLIGKYDMRPDFLPILSFAIIFIAIVVTIHLLAKIIEKLADLTALSFVNRLMGAVFNIVKYTFIISVILVVLNNINRKTHFISEKQMNSSILYYPLSVITPMIFPYLRYNFFPLKDDPPSKNIEITV